LHPRTAIAASIVAEAYRVSREPIRVTTRPAIVVSETARGIRPEGRGSDWATPPPTGRR